MKARLNEQSWLWLWIPSVVLVQEMSRESWISKGTHLEKGRSWEGVKDKASSIHNFAQIYSWLHTSACIRKERAISNWDDYGMTTIKLDREQLIYYFQSCFIISSVAVDYTFHAWRQIRKNQSAKTLTIPLPKSTLSVHSAFPAYFMLSIT